MKKVCLMLSVLLFASASFATDYDDSVVRWKNIEGVITAQNVDNPVSTKIHSGLLPGLPATAAPEWISRREQLRSTSRDW